MSVDESYRETKKMVDAGQLGNVHLIRSATCDQYDPTGELLSQMSHGCELTI